jgi:5'(3')-deoxyribonucleotidase
MFADLQPIPGAIEAVRCLQEKYTVRICTKPLATSEFCIPEKKAWVERYLGKQLMDSMIITPDKYLQDGVVLIDDHPTPLLAEKASWQQIVFTQPYNLHLHKPRIDGWCCDYMRVIEETIELAHEHKKIKAIVAQEKL